MSAPAYARLLAAVTDLPNSTSKAATTVTTIKLTAASTTVLRPHAAMALLNSVLRTATTVTRSTMTPVQMTVGRPVAEMESSKLMKHAMMAI